MCNIKLCDWDVQKGNVKLKGSELKEGDVIVGIGVVESVDENVVTFAVGEHDPLFTMHVYAWTDADYFVWRDAA